MAKQIENDKGFLILSVDEQDLKNIESPGICDSCSDRIKEGKYISALNHIYCNHCYEVWSKRAIYYEEDRRIELKNFSLYKRMFKGRGTGYHLNL